ncbi:MAG TPA: HPF/RaiA family ribosome-associated protein [Bryobacteraceae bacterium]|nr:HPF/RaiA family ribosome-associated protein [Bryobacteraceae bacterium]
MTVSYTGKLELDRGQQGKLEAKYAKIGKLLDASNKGDRQAHIILNHNRGVHQAEITVNYMDHSLVGAGADGEQYNALLIAVERLEKQILKVRDKRRDPKFGPKEVREKTEVEGTRGPSQFLPASEAGNGRRQVFRVAPGDQKPMTVEEAMLVIDDDSYLVYVDAETERLAVLLRRPDGNFDLVQC